MNKTLWVVQGLLALLFLFTGLTKLLMPIPLLESQMPAPMADWFLRFLGVAELLGALGLVLPGVLRIRPWLTPLAAAGLVCIMTGATLYTVRYDGLVPALLPAITGGLAAFVLYGRLRLVPLAGRSRTANLQTHSASA